MRYLIFSTVLALAGCAFIGETESRVLEAGAVADIRAAPVAVHLAYLQCYGLPEPEEAICRRRMDNLPLERQNARNREYIWPYEAEAVRLGFAAFLTNQGQPCPAIETDPQYDRKRKEFTVTCVGGHNYRMRFDRKTEKWSISR